MLDNRITRFDSWQRQQIFLYSKEFRPVLVPKHQWQLFSPRQSDRNRNLFIHWHLVPRLGKSELIFPPTHKPSCPTRETLTVLIPKSLKSECEIFTEIKTTCLSLSCLKTNALILVFVFLRLHFVLWNQISGSVISPSIKTELLKLVTTTYRQRRSTLLLYLAATDTTELKSFCLDHRRI